MDDVASGNRHRFLGGPYVQLPVVAHSYGASRHDLATRQTHHDIAPDREAQAPIGIEGEARSVATQADQPRM